MIVKKFDCVIGLGSACQTAYQLKRKGLRQNAGPFDWLISPAASLIEVLKNDFEGVMLLSNLKIVGQKNGRYTVQDTRYNLKSMHDFHVQNGGADPLIEYAAFKEKLDRRIGAFRAQLETVPAVLFVQCGANKEEGLVLFDLLKTGRLGKHTELLVVNDADEFEAAWHVDGILPRRIRFPKDASDGNWKGDREEWGRVLHDIALTKSGPRQLKDRIVCTRVYEKCEKLYNRVSVALKKE